MAKKLYELSVDELKKKSRNYSSRFWGYVIAAIGIGFINGFFGIQSLNNVMALQHDTSLFYFLLMLSLTSIMIFLILFLWFISESSYYKMLEQFSDLMIYLKQKEK